MTQKEQADTSQNLMKGYIARERGIVVLSKGGAFPGTGVWASFSPYPILSFYFLRWRWWVNGQATSRLGSIVRSPPLTFKKPQACAKEIAN
jgi:hypothetical protein